MAEGCEEKLDMEFVHWVLFRGRNKKKREAFLKIRRQYPQKTLVLKTPAQVTVYLQKAYEMTESMGI